MRIPAAFCCGEKPVNRGWLNVMHDVQDAEVVTILLGRVRHWRICVGVALAGDGWDMLSRRVQNHARGHRIGGEKSPYYLKRKLQTIGDAWSHGRMAKKLNILHSKLRFEWKITWEHAAHFLRAKMRKHVSA